MDNSVLIFGDGGGVIIWVEHHGLMEVDFIHFYKGE